MPIDTETYTQVDLNYASNQLDQDKTEPEVTAPDVVVEQQHRTFDDPLPNEAEQQPQLPTPEQRQQLIDVVDGYLHSKMFYLEDAEDALNKIRKGILLDLIEKNDPELFNRIAELHNITLAARLFKATGVIQPPAGGTDSTALSTKIEQSGVVLATNTIDYKRIADGTNLEEKAEITVETPSGERKKMTLTQLAFLAVLVAGDLSFNRGQGLAIALHNVIEPMSRETASIFMTQLGFNVSPELRNNDAYFRRFIELITTDNLHRELLHMPDRSYELVTFLEKFDEEERNNLFQGKPFGGRSRAQHVFTESQVGDLKKKLTDKQLAELNIQSTSS